MLIFCSGAPRRTNENAKLIITTIVGMVFGFFIGITLPSGSFRKVYEVGSHRYIFLSCLFSPVDIFCILQINLPSGLISSLDVAMSDGKLFSGGRSPEDFGSREFPKVYLLKHLCNFNC